MTEWKNYPEVTLDMSSDFSAARIMTKSGDVLIYDTSCDTDTLERSVVCWNACRKIAFPDAHITAQDDYCKRLEQLRKDAVAMAGAGEGGWNFDMSTAPRDGTDIIATSKCGKVIKTYIVKVKGSTDRWAGFATGEEPVAWMPWPVAAVGPLAEVAA
ncbi:hypothetical protein LH464_21465 [Neorhizobium sp. T786]|uniref:hypothetical protein n=1 Tax=Pseudorhizobium xiangyangii TaxID=2883104 RepID=UPI001CFFE47C|nr:hypothetical protein [Neorhizobium xiangyangii]MCB5205038.1 hypothetical protein [Neorhizobium xiangyangii]